MLRRDPFTLKHLDHLFSDIQQIQTFIVFDHTIERLLTVRNC